MHVTHPIHPVRILRVTADELYRLSNSAPAHITAPDINVNLDNLYSLDFVCFAPVDPELASFLFGIVLDGSCG